MSDKTVSEARAKTSRQFAMQLILDILDEYEDDWVQWYRDDNTKEDGDEIVTEYRKIKRILELKSAGRRSRRL